MFMILFIDRLKVDDVILCDQLMNIFMDWKYDDVSAPIQEFDQCSTYFSRVSTSLVWKAYEWWQFIQKAKGFLLYKIVFDKFG